MDVDPKANSTTIVFGGGCFWCTEAVFKMLRGVQSVTPGYAGGTAQHPTYEKVSSGKSGHAEVIKIVYDPAAISLHDLLVVFFGSHDPTTVNRQGADIGEQYRSIILFTDESQKTESEQFIRDLNNSAKEGLSVVTEVAPLGEFYEAEEYHKDYFAKNRSQPYCQVIINPKLKKVQEKYAALLKK